MPKMEVLKNKFVTIYSFLDISYSLLEIGSYSKEN